MTSTTAALAWVNLFDSATVTTQTAATNTPASNLQVAHVQRKWRGTNGASEWILATFSANQSADTFMLNGLGSDLAIGSMTGRLRLSSSDATGAVGDIYDTNTSGLAPTIDANYGYLIHLIPTVQTGWKYARWDLARTSAAYIEAGRGAITNRTQLTYNFAPGAQRTYVDRSKITESYDGQQYVDRRSKYRTWEVNFEWVDTTQRNSVFEAIDIANGLQTDVLFVSDPTSTNLGRDCLWGLMSQIDPVILFDPTAQLVSHAFKIRERR